MRSRASRLVNGAVVTREIATDRPPERLLLQTLAGNTDVEFWSVRDSARHWAMVHDTYTACFVLPSTRGFARWHSRGATRTVGAGCIQLMEPGEAHRTLHVEEPASFFVVWWKPEALERTALELGIGGRLHFKLAQLEPGVANALSALAKSVNDGEDRLAVETALAESALELLTHAAEGSVARPTHSGRHPGVRKAAERLHDGFRDSLSLDELAAEANLSKFHLVRCFREATGFPPHQYQKLLRVREARRLIGSGCSVQEAAARAGFADGPHLTRAFRSWVGSAPGAFAG